ncbi:MAG: FkbM family methyltransferase [Pseudomonadota bacterium]
METLRRSVKKITQHAPFLFKPAKAVYNRIKAQGDTRAVNAAHTGVEIIQYSADQIANLRAQGWGSQYGQDHYLLTQVFANQDKGTFVEIGANHPVANNNSHAFEARGWTGYAFDPLSRFEDNWASTRQTPFFRAAVSPDIGTRDFTEFEDCEGWEHQISGFADMTRPEDLEHFSHKTYPVPCGPISHFVPDLGDVTLALIDVEGAELIVLDALELNRRRVHWILIENMRQIGGDPRVRDKLIPLGYRLRARIAATDDLFEYVGVS